MPAIDPDRWRTLQPLLDHALELSASERPTWLATLRERDPSLADDVATLLAREDDADRGGFLAVPLVPSLAGTRLGPWVLEQPLGQGGMGSVWLARRADGRFEGRAAVKLMNLALLSPTGQDRFRREGSVLARLAHPGIARLLDAGVASSGQPYLVLEHVDGQRIDDFATTHALGREARIGLVLQVLDAVSHAHANLIVHRDIKPSNILVTADGTAKLLDFGIAKLLEDERAGERTGLTGDGGALTPDYAAPEQVRGEPVTTATDVYAAGVLLYLLLAGRHPTRADGHAPADVVRGVLETEPARLGLGDLDTVVARALRKHPPERYQTAAAFADDLRRWLRREPVSARPDSLAYRARKFVARNRVGVAAAAMVAVVLVGATAFSLRQMRVARDQRDAAVRSARRATAMSELQSVLAGDTRGPDGAPLPPADRIALAERVLVRQFSGEPWLVSHVMSTLSRRFYENGDRESQRRMLGRARAIALESRLPPQLALADCFRASSFWYDDQLDSARAALAEANAALGGAGAAADESVHLVCLEAEGKVLQATGRGDSAVALLRRAAVLVENDTADTDRLQVYNALSEVLRLTGRTREAIPYQRYHLLQVERTGRDETEELSNAASFLERSLSELGEFAVADSALGALVRAREAVHGAGHAPTLLAFLYGQNKLRLGALDSAEAWIARVVRDTTSDAGAMSVWLPFALAQLRLDQGRPADARAHVARLAGGPRGRRATRAMLRARLRHADGDASGAAALLEGELAGIYREPGALLSQFTLPLVTAGEWRLAAGDARRADSLARLARRAAALDTPALSRSAHAGRAELLLARALRARGDVPAAREAARRAQIALANGYGSAHAWTLAARALADSLAR